MKKAIILIVIFLFSVSFAFAICGDGTVDSGEQCDDGDSINSNGCKNNCKMRENYRCDPFWNQSAGAATGSGPSVCTWICRNGIIEDSSNCEGPTIDGCFLDPNDQEECDDGDNNNANGCKNGCGIRDGWRCAPFFNESSGLATGYEISSCEYLCGNEVIDIDQDTCKGPGIDGCKFYGGGLTYEECDHGKQCYQYGPECDSDEDCDEGETCGTHNNDGCSSSTCRIDDGWECLPFYNATSGNASDGGESICDRLCTNCQIDNSDNCLGPTIDGCHLSWNETCDDGEGGNLDHHDGCARLCTINEPEKWDLVDVNGDGLHDGVCGLELQEEPVPELSSMGIVGIVLVLGLGLFLMKKK